MYYNRNLITAEQHLTDAEEASGVFDLNTQAFSQSQKNWPIPSDDFDFAVRIEIPFARTVKFARQTYGAVTYTIDWGDGTALSTENGSTIYHTYSADGIYIVKCTRISGATLGLNSISASITAIFASSNYVSAAKFSLNQQYNFDVLSVPFSIFASVTDFASNFRLCVSLKKFPLLDVSSGTNFSKAWENCYTLESFPALSFNSATSLEGAWLRCAHLRVFPLITNTSNVTNFQGCWSGCSSLISFPLIDTSSGTNFQSCWSGCTYISSFPTIGTSNGTTFYAAWQGCETLTTFPALNFTSGTQFRNGWQNCYLLASFEANMFDSTGTLASNAFIRAFQNCALTAQSIENILTSLVTNGATGITLEITGGTNAAYSTWSSAAQTALTTLQSRSWNVIYNT